MMSTKWLSHARVDEALLLLCCLGPGFSSGGPESVLVIRTGGQSHGTLTGHPSFSPPFYRFLSVFLYFSVLLHFFLSPFLFLPLSVFLSLCISLFLSPIFLSLLLSFFLCISLSVYFSLLSILLSLSHLSLAFHFCFLLHLSFWVHSSFSSSTVSLPASITLLLLVSFQFNMALIPRHPHSNANAL